MAKKAHPHQTKPYEQKMAERNAAKRAMRTGGDMGSSSKSEARPSQQSFQQRKNP